jgi:molybdate transport system substrate-binding protein
MKRIGSLCGLLAALLGSAAAAPAQELLVFGAASLTESLQEIGKAFELKEAVKVRFSFGASSDLARQIQAGAPADVFFSADTAKMDTLEKAGLVRHEDRREFLSNCLVIVVASASPLSIQKPEDLVALRHFALPDPEAVPAGIYAKKWLESLGLWKDAPTKFVPTLDVRAALAAVESELAPAGIVYRTDAAISQKVRIAYEVTHGPEISYSVAPLSAKPAATAFVEFLMGDTGRRVFARRGFIVTK